MMQQQIAQLSLLVDRAYGTDLSGALAAPGGPPPGSSGEGMNIEEMTGESSITRNARARTAQAVQPR